EEVTFHSGGEFPVTTAVEQGLGIARKVEWKSYGLGVRILPRSADRFHMNTDIKIELSEPVGEAVDGIPALHRRKLETRMISREGETVILSGLVRQLTQRSGVGTPLLGKIPILGIFFERKSDRRTRNEVLMAMT